MYYNYIDIINNLNKDEHHNVAESAVVGYSHKIYGEGIFAFITLKENVNEAEEQIIKELKQNVKKKISGYAVPHNFLVKFKFFRLIVTL